MIRRTMIRRTIGSRPTGHSWMGAGERVVGIVELSLQFVDPKKQLIPVQMLAERAAQFHNFECRGTDAQVVAGPQWSLDELVAIKSRVSRPATYDRPVRSAKDQAMEAGHLFAMDLDRALVRRADRTLRGQYSQFLLVVACPVDTEDHRPARRTYERCIGGIDSCGKTCVVLACHCPFSNGVVIEEASRLPRIEFT